MLSVLYEQNIFILIKPQSTGKSIYPSSVHNNRTFICEFCEQIHGELDRLYILRICKIVKDIRENIGNDMTFVHMVSCFTLSISDAYYSFILFGLLLVFEGRTRLPVVD